jgi:putative oxidoreductase
VSRKAFPVSADLALLVLRVAFGVTMAVLHGWDKAATLFAGDGSQFPSVLGLPSLLSSALAVLAEVVAALLVAVGLLTRMSAAYLSIFFIVTVVVMHGGALAGEQGGELAFLYLSAFAAITLVGPGGYSVDRLLRRRLSAD